jgi:hypothetical protein
LFHFFSNAPAAATLCVIDLPRKKIALYSSKNKRRKGKKILVPQHQFPPLMPEAECLFTYVP